MFNFTADIYTVNEQVPLTTILDGMKQNELQIDSMEMVKPTIDINNTAAAIMTLRLKKKRIKLDVIAKINAIGGVEFVEEI